MTGMPEVSPAWHFATAMGTSAFGVASCAEVFRYTSASAWQYFASADWANAVTGKVSAKQAINNLVAEVMIDPPHVMTAPRGPDLATHDVARFDHRQGSFDIRRSTVLGAALAVLVGHWV
ncbi:MAG TPA: hypothetical protein VK777_26190 [Reyranella sp.]|jgi:hypothetical protein|nr:hypothetical protein [Reyranella sp.]